MYNHYYNQRGFRVSFRRSLGRAIGHTVGHAIVHIGAETMQKLLENRHRIVDAEWETVKPPHMRWQAKHAKFGTNDFSNNWNKPSATAASVNTNWHYPRPIVSAKTPLYKIAFFMFIGAVAWTYIGAEYLLSTPKDVIGYHYLPNGQKLCYMRNTSNRISEWDSFPVKCP